MNRGIGQLLLLFGPIGLAVCSLLYLYPDFDEFDVPLTREQLSRVQGVVKDTYSLSSKGQRNFFIEVDVDGEEMDIKVFSCCMERYIGREVIALVYPDFLGRWFDIAWDLRLASGETIYSYEQWLVRYGREVSHRRGMAKWGVLLGLVVTPLWFVRRKRSKGSSP